MNRTDWEIVNRQLVAKMLAELEYEQVFHAESLGDDRHAINLPGAEWHFSAQRGIWGWLWIDPETLRCADEPVVAQTLLMQLKPVLSMSDATVAEHMQDLYATLLGDLQLHNARRGLSAEDLPIGCSACSAVIQNSPLIRAVAAGDRTRLHAMPRSTPIPSSFTGWR